MLRRGVLLLAACVALVACGGSRPAESPPATRASLESPSGDFAASQAPGPVSQKRRGNLDLTFLVFSDTHFGFRSSEGDGRGGLRDPVKNPKGLDEVNLAAITDMNAIAAKPWPPALGGTIGEPRGLIVSGDLTEDGEPWQWRHFAAYYGLGGGDGLLRYPVFEGHGNHDQNHGTSVLERIRGRHGSTHYSFDWDDLHVACLGEAPDDAVLAWLRDDLASAGRERPVLAYLHFPLLGEHSEGQWFGDGGYRKKLRRTLQGYNVVAIFHGHFHPSGRYRWQDWDVYNVGAAKQGFNSFAVVHVSDSRFRVASWQFVENRWEWWHEKPINGSNRAVIRGGTHVYSGKKFADD